MLLQMGGSGGEVAIRVQIGASQPAGAAGMIWVNTTRVSNKWTAAVAQPADPATGDIWVQADASSANVISLLKKPSTVAKICVLRVKQYDGNSFVSMVAYYHNGANWTQISAAIFNPATDFSYTGTSSVIDDGGGHWRIKFLTSGILTLTNDALIDAFLVGGGGGGGTANNAGGGGGGYTGTHSTENVASGAYTIVVGAGGSAGNSGGASTAFGYSANGGLSTASVLGGKGGSGGGGASALDTAGGSGGTNGGNGRTAGNGADSGIGQGSTTYEFGNSGLTLYGGGGGGGSYQGAGGTGGSGGGGNGGRGTPAYSSTVGAANTGGGGGGRGMENVASSAGGSGIVVIRDHRAE